KIIQNAYPIINSSTVNDNSNTNVAAIIDEEDVNDPSGIIYQFFSINMITGMDVGTWAIVPGALISPNFQISYTLGTLTINPDTLIIKADNKTVTYGTAPSYSYTATGFDYYDNAANT